MIRRDEEVKRRKKPWMTISSCSVDEKNEEFSCPASPKDQKKPCMILSNGLFFCWVDFVLT